MKVIVRFEFDIKELPDDDSYQHWIGSACQELAKGEDETWNDKVQPWDKYNLKYQVIQGDDVLITEEGMTTIHFERQYRKQTQRLTK